MGAFFFERQWCRPLTELTQEERFQIVGWAMRTLDRDTRYWRPAWDKGRVCLENVEGKIFTPAELAEYDEREIVPIQTPELKPAMDAIMGELLKTGKSGAVTAVGAEDAEGAFIRTVIIKAAERENQLRFREAQVARDTFITSVPGWLWIEAHDPMNPDEPGLTVVQEEWDGVIPDASWTDRQLRDLTRATRIRRWTRDEVDAFVQDDVTKELMLQQMDAWAQGLPNNYDGRATLIENIRNSRMQWDQTGRLAVFEMTHWVRMRSVVWYNPLTQDSGKLPPSWNQDEIAQWQQQNPGVILDARDNQKVLWTTTFTGTGILLANGEHWNQSCIFPGIPCVPDRLNGKWAGIVEFVLDVIKAGAYAETEWAESIRTLTKNLIKAKRGAIRDWDEARRQIAMSNGILEVEPGFSLEDVQFMDNKREQSAFLEWKNASREQLARLLVPDNFVGGVQSSQEANSAIETRIDQTLARLAPVVWGWHAFRLQIRRALTKAMPFAITTNKVYRFVDPLNGAQAVNVNQPVDWDVYGNVISTMNDLSGDEYDYIETEEDDSLSGQEMERQQLLQFMEKWGNLPPESLISMAKSYPSVAVQKFGKEMEQQRANTPPPGPEVKASATLALDKLAGNLLAQKAAVALGILSQQDLESLSKQPPQMDGTQQIDLPPQANASTFPDGSMGVPETQGITQQ